MTLEPLLNAPPVIQLHGVSAFLALLIGTVQLFRRKGDPPHKALGRTWVGLMAIVALSSFFIWTIRMMWVFSPIHFISIFVLVMLFLGVRAARRGDIARHMRTMKYTYFLGLVVTGLLTFIPGRTMYHMAFGPEGATAQKVAVFAAIVVVAGAFALIFNWWRTTPSGKAFVASH